MRIKHIKIHNFRSIKDLEIIASPLTRLIGANNHGKSNIIGALDFFFSTSYKITPQEFFVFRDERDTQCWVEIVFDNLMDSEKITFKKYLIQNQTIEIRKIATINDISIATAYHGYVVEPKQKWLQSNEVAGLVDTARETPLKEYLPEKGKLTQAKIREAQEKYITDNGSSLEFEKNLEPGQLLGQKNIGGGVLPDFYLVPAVKDLSDETKIKTTTVLGKLLNLAIQEMAESDPSYIEIKERLTDLVSRFNNSSANNDRPKQLIELEHNLQSELTDWGVSVGLEVTPPLLEKLFELGTCLHLDDGVNTPAEAKGHGLQRAVIFALIKAWASCQKNKPSGAEGRSSRKSSESIVFAMEEPELYLHPHAQRKLFCSLEGLSKNVGHQIFLCTHSTYFIDLDDYKSIVIVYKNSAKSGTVIRQCNDDLFEGDSTQDKKQRFHMAKWINPDRGEMFFAKKTVFVEGETEKNVIPFLANKMRCLNEDVSIIDCGSKHNLPLYITIANAFKIPYVVVHDEDPLPDPIPTCWSGDKRKAKGDTFKLNSSIKASIDASIGREYMLRPDFEKATGVSKGSGEKIGKALAAIEHFEEKGQEEIPQTLKELLELIYGAC